MRISNKISLFILFLLAVLAANTLIGLGQLSKISGELQDVVSQDIVIADTTNSIINNQLKKNVLFESLFRITEELGFEDITESRKYHLVDTLKRIEGSFLALSNEDKEEIGKVKQIIDANIGMYQPIERTKSLKAARDIINKIDGAHLAYDKLVQDILKMARGEDFQLSIDNLDRIRTGGRRLDLETKELVEEVRKFSKRSLLRARQEEKVAKSVLWVSLLISVIISSIIAAAIIRSILTPLRNLTKAAQKIGTGDFLVKVKTDSKDEIGEVGNAFNIMTTKLNEFTKKLNEKKEVLAKTLKVTENQKQDLEKVNRELDDFVQTITHDIKAPLTGIKGYAAYLDSHSKEKLDDHGKRALKGIMHSSDHLIDLIAELLALTKISRIRNPYEKTDIKNIVDAALENLEYNIEKSNVDLIMPKELPKIYCDPIKIGLVFYNLMSNAIKFSSKDNEKRPQVEITCDEQKDFYEFCISDNGIGIPKNEQDKVFDIFKRLSNAQGYEGSGAGLSIVKRVVEEHGGKVWVESEEGWGSDFRFTIAKQN